MRRFALLLLLFISPPLIAEDLYMVRSQLSFPEAMSVLQEVIKEHHYKVSRVQRVDIGLTNFGYETDKYRVVFFGNLEEIRLVTDQYPDLVPYMPMKIAIFAEDEETILLASSFRHLRSVYPSSGIQKKFDRWETDIRAILEMVRTAE